MRSIRTWAAAVLIAMGTAGAGCSSEHLYCEAFCDCEGCNDEAFQACRTQLDGTRSYAESSGCGDEYDAYLTCATDTGTCDAEQTFIDGTCEAENAAFVDCLGGEGPE